LVGTLVYDSSELLMTDRRGPTRADSTAYRDALAFIASELAALGTLRPEDIGPETKLVGADSLIKSSELVVLLLALEDYSEQHLGRPFDWRSDSAFSELRSAFRTAGTLAEHVVAPRGAAA
jgi:hypothetical protein